LSPHPTPADRFQTFQAAHGLLESPMADRILSAFFTRAIERYHQHGPSSFNGATLAVAVADEIKRQAPDILAVLELAADWSTDPLAAAARQVRPELESKANAEAAAKRREEENQLRAEIQKKADQFAAEALGKAGIKK
jgi:hypothetical protein